ncbi:type 1 fimbrial protein [Lelliottia amnigena]|uniref:Type 1 fimbrial protein n=1 Tax=Lelliottia amnigena TaxID=61646 RepID=A0ABU7U7C4_LELAM
MKKTLIGLTLMSLFVAGAVQAVDHPATVDITGSLIGDGTECTFDIAEGTAINLYGAIGDLPNQGQNALAPTKMEYKLTNACDINTFALQLHGVVDNADGTVLTNDDISSTAAKGIGVGVFNSDSSPVDVNGRINIPESKSQRYLNLQMVKLNGQTAIEGTVNSALTIDIVRL